ncbi:hypothetical protein ACHAWF_014095 [Thalassiosira exigua]
MDRNRRLPPATSRARVVGRVVPKNRRFAALGVEASRIPAFRLPPSAFVAGTFENPTEVGPRRGPEPPGSKTRSFVAVVLPTRPAGGSNKRRGEGADRPTTATPRTQHGNGSTSRKAERTPRVAAPRFSSRRDRSQTPGRPVGRRIPRRRASDSRRNRAAAPLLARSRRRRARPNHFPGIGASPLPRPPNDPAPSRAGSRERFGRGSNASRAFVVSSDAIKELRKHVDTLIVVSNDKLLRIVPENIPVTDAFPVADDILRQGVVGISDIIINTGLVNVDFADVHAVIRDAGTALMGVGTGVDKSRATDTAVAISSPLLDFPISEAKRVVFNVVGGSDLRFSEINAASEVTRTGTSFSERSSIPTPDMGEEVSITVLACGGVDGGDFGGGARSRRWCGTTRGSTGPRTSTRSGER